MHHCLISGIMNCLVNIVELVFQSYGMPSVWDPIIYGALCLAASRMLLAGWSIKLGLSRVIHGGWQECFVSVLGQS